MIATSSTPLSGCVEETTGRGRRDRHRHPGYGDGREVRLPTPGTYRGTAPSHAVTATALKRRETDKG